MSPDSASGIASTHERCLIRTARSEAGAFERLAAAPLGADVIPGYRIIGEIHRGGQGVVYKAYQESTQRQVAIKVMRQGAFAGPRERARFKREVRILGQLRHPNIVVVHDSGTAEGCFYCVMDYVAGRPLDLDGACARSLSDTVQLFGKICNALNCAHASGIVHRDLKPGNILIDADGEPRILDFGLAKLEADGGSVMTESGQFVGTLPWASPEQALGGAHIDVRSDVYSLGVMLYHGLTGRFPYDVDGSLPEVLNNLLTTDPVRPATICRHIDGDLETIVLTCLQKDPGRRYRSAAELSTDLRYYQSGEAIQARRDSGWYVLRKSLRRHRVMVVAVSAFAVVVSIAAMWLAVLYQALSGQFERARREADRARQTSDFLVQVLEHPKTMSDDSLSVREVLDRAQRRFEEGDPIVRARQMQVLARAFQNLGELDDALRLTEQALALRREHLGPRHGEVAESLQHLALIRLARSEVELVEPLLDQARDILRGVPGADPRELSEALRMVGELLYCQGDYEGSVRRHRDAVEACRQHFDPAHADVARAELGLGEALRARGLYAEAEPLLEKHINRARKSGRRDLGLAYRSQALGLLRLEQTRFDEAERLLREALSIRRAILGRRAQVALSLNTLGLAVQSRMRYSEAEQLYREGLAILDGCAAGYPEYRYYLLKNLGSVLMDSGRDLEATAALHEARQLGVASLGANHPELADALVGLSELALRAGDAAHAESLCRRALELRQRALIASHPSVTACQALLERILRTSSG